ncbi:class I SAM-dependent methyltransferase [Streptomyces sp. NPDC059917]|uniref:class I SAM-dependent methyltransferase n=1 Tax=Streptomyces sp. NPDC059917 TaxID=3347002 RepID=UPI00365FCA65
MDDPKRHALDALASQAAFDEALRKIDADAGFDAAHGIDTSTVVEPWEIEEADAATLEHNSRYSPTPLRTIRQALAASPLRHEDVSFVDFGSGKGRVLLVAGELPFRSVIGVEFSRSLCETSRRNIERFGTDRRRCGSIEVHHGDAARYAVPDDAGFFFLYEPFTGTIARAVLANIRASLLRRPRGAVLCLVGDDLLPVIAQDPEWERVGEVLVSPDAPYFDTHLFSFAPRP